AEEHGAARQQPQFPVADRGAGTEAGDHRDQADDDGEYQRAPAQPAQAEDRIAAIARPDRVAAHQPFGGQRPRQGIIARSGVHGRVQHSLPWPQLRGPRSTWPPWCRLTADTLPSPSRSKRTSAPTASTANTSGATAVAASGDWPVPCTCSTPFTTVMVRAKPGTSGYSPT